MHSFGTFAGARAHHHQGLRWLKPCQFQRNVYWYCEFDKLRPAAQFQLLAVCSSLTRGRRANEVVSPGFQWQIWKFRSTMVVTRKQLLHYRSLVRDLSKKYRIGWRLVFPTQRSFKFPRMQCSQIPAGWLLG